MPYVYADDNTRLFYVDTQVGRPLLLFTAGAWLDCRIWEHQLSYFAERGFRCIAYDRRGHGRSDWPWSGYDYDTLARDLNTLISHLELRDLVLVGHSAGAGEIVRCVARYGATQPIAGIALISPTTPFMMKTDDNPDGIERSVMEADLAVRMRDRAKWFADHADSFFGVGLPGVEVSAELRERVIRECLTCFPQAAKAFLVTGFTSDLRRDLAKISVPTLVVHGTHDAEAPLALCGERTAKLIAGSDLRVYENAAHGLIVTHADRLNADLDAFASSLVAVRVKAVRSRTERRG